MSAGSTLALLAAKCAPRVFDLSSDLRNVSIRDQVVRAQLLVRELLQEPECRRVLIVGAGVAGVAAGAALADTGCETLLVERNAKPLSLQRACTWRYVGPFMYEWPSSFFGDQSYPPTGTDWPHAPAATPTWTSAVPLTASAFASQMLTWLQGLVRPPAVLTGIDPAEVTRYVQAFVQHWRAQHAAPAPFMQRPNLPLLGLYGDIWLGKLKSVYFDADYVILAGGMGHEGVELTDPVLKKGLGVSGPGFWTEPDALQAASTADEATGVFGGGDGALQDVLRALTPFDHPLQMWQALRQHHAGLQTKLDAELPTLSALEQQHRLVAAWHPTQDSARSITIDAACQRMAGRLAGDTLVQQAIESCLRRGSGRVDHFVMERHFGKAYLLNRFLVHLIAECVARGAITPACMAYRRHLGGHAVAAREPGSRRRFEIKVQHPHGVLDHHFDHLAVRFGPKGAPARQLVTLSKDDQAWRTSLSGLQLPFVVPD
ncbi:FAD-dependent monooxygenase [Roseateles paludis]|jgi:hypothetical protein|uniref:FAD-dependent monooxygenase n=1 Tax=Roseateles paludis TaxID=3145238 RepID=A0ABV0G683_9BURK